MAAVNGLADGGKCATDGGAAGDGVTAANGCAKGCTGS